MVINQLYTVCSDLNSIAHWIFALKYFEVALNFKLLVGVVEADKFEERKTRAKRIKFWMNIVFYVYSQILILWRFI